LPDGERAYLSLVVELGRNCASSSVNAKDRKYEGCINVSQLGSLLIPCATVLADAMFLPSGHFAREMISRDYKSQAATRSTGAK
jgi:hypothetical protein